MDSRTEDFDKIVPRPDIAASRREEIPFSPTSLYSRQTDDDEDRRGKSRLAGIEKGFRTLSVNILRSDAGFSSQERLVIDSGVKTEVRVWWRGAYVSD